MGYEKVFFIYFLPAGPWETGSQNSSIGLLCNKAAKLSANAGKKICGAAAGLLVRPYAASR